MNVLLSLPPEELTGGVYRSALNAEQRMGTSGFALSAVVLHAAILAAALWLPKLMEREVAVRKPVIARLVALGKPRPKGALPRKETGGAPPVASAPISTPSPTPSKLTAPHSRAPQSPRKPAPKQPSRQELMKRALAQAAGQSVAAERQSEEPPVEREGIAEGSAEGTASTAEIGDKYFTAVHDAILQNYVLPSVISERERLYLKASLVAYIGTDGTLLRHTILKPSGNAIFDQALELALQKTKLPAPPPELASSLRSDGVELNFKP